MKLMLKKWTINPDLDVKRQIKERELDVKAMVMLNDTSLSDEAFLEIISKVYELDLRDVDSLVKEMLGFDRVDKKAIDTNIIEYKNGFSSDKYNYLGAFRYNQHKWSLKSLFKKFKKKKDEKLSLETIEAEIREKKCVYANIGMMGEVKRFTPTEKNDGDYVMKIFWANEKMRRLRPKMESLDITKISLNNLGIYKEWLIPLIRKYFTMNRVRNDIVGLIRVSEMGLEVYKNVFDKEKQYDKLMSQTNFIEEMKDLENSQTISLARRIG